MTLTGDLFIGAARVKTKERFNAVNPATGETLDTDFSAAGPDEAERACTLAADAFRSFEQAGPDLRATLLERIAENILGLGDELLERAEAETGLPPVRLTGERGRTVNQLKLFAAELRDGGWQGVRIDHAMPEREPLPRPDLRMYKKPLGPAAIFGASNFPLAFSVAGGDTASALAAGCPVVVKGHPAHPGTCELIAQAIADAVKALGLPEGVFSMLNGPSHELGRAIVSHAAIKGVGFTGSRQGGLALMKAAAERKEPIPVYAEMSAINLVILLPGALKDKGEQLGREFIGSLTMGAGQFCTNPGLVLALEGSGLDTFIAGAKSAMEDAQPQVMLTSGIYDAYDKGVARLSSSGEATLIAAGPEKSGCNLGQAAFFSITANTFISNEAFSAEVFGASSILVRCADEASLIAALSSLEGQLTATVHFTESDHDAVNTLAPVLEEKAGRLIANGWPTGVEVCHAMVHGGPFPATSDSRTTSVGTLAIDRWLRPVCYQDFPSALLPESLRDDGKKNTLRRINGTWTV